MRYVLPICAGLVVLSGVVSATMWSDLRAERQSSNSLRAQLTDANSRIQALMRSAQHSGEQPGAAQAITMSSDAKASASPTPVTASQPAAAVSAPPPMDPDAREKEMMKDPEYRKARIVQRRLDMQSSYPGLAEELGLSQTESDRLFDLLIKQRDEFPEKLEALLANDRVFDPGDTVVVIDQESIERERRRREPLRLEEGKQVAALLGPGLYAKWQVYENERLGRAQAILLGRQLVDAGLPLTFSQQRALTSILATERDRLDEERAPLRNVDQTDPLVSLQVHQQKMRMADESNRRVLDAAAATLSSRQIARLRQYFETLSATISAQDKMAERTLKAQGSGRASQ